MTILDRKSLKQKYAGKAQFNAVREEILALLRDGYSRRALYAELHAKGAFSGSYRRFCEYVQDIERRARGDTNPEPAASLAEPAPPVAPQSTTPLAVQAEKPAATGFNHTTAPKIGDLI